MNKYPTHVMKRIIKDRETGEGASSPYRKDTTALNSTISKENKEIDPTHTYDIETPQSETDHTQPLLERPPAKKITAKHTPDRIWVQANVPQTAGATNLMSNSLHNDSLLSHEQDVAPLEYVMERMEEQTPVSSSRPTAMQSKQGQEVADEVEDDQMVDEDDEISHTPKPVRSGKEKRPTIAENLDTLLSPMEASGENIA